MLLDCVSDEVYADAFVADEAGFIDVAGVSPVLCVKTVCRVVG